MRKTGMWFVYIMAAPDGEGDTFFKVGITSVVTKRIGQVQTGCPLKIKQVWILPVWSNGAAQMIEKMMHDSLKEFGSQGEWFRMDTGLPEHKKAMKSATERAAHAASQDCIRKWMALDRAALQQCLLESKAVTTKRTACQRAASGRLYAQC